MYPTKVEGALWTWNAEATRGLCKYMMVFGCFNYVPTYTALIYISQTLLVILNTQAFTVGLGVMT